MTLQAMIEDPRRTSDPSRIVEVSAGGPAATGYAIAPDLVLTVAQPSGPARVRPAGRSTWTGSVAVWRGTGRPGPVLLRTDEPLWMMDGTRWGAVDAVHPECIVAAFPVGGRGEPRLLTGRVDVADPRPALLRLELAEPGPVGALTGAPVLAAGRLIGIVDATASPGEPTAIPVTVLLRDNGFTGVTGTRPGDAEPVGDFATVPVLQAMTTMPSDSSAPTPGDWWRLSPQRAAVGFLGRAELLSELHDWAVTVRGRFAVAVVTGEQGSGRTRLAGQLCRQLDGEGWDAGLCTTATLSDIDGPLDATRPTLLVVEDPATRLARLTVLVERLAARRHGPPMRLLLTADTDGSADGVAESVWWHSLTDATGGAMTTVDTQVVSLDRAPLSTPDRMRHFDTAVAAFDGEPVPRERVPDLTGPRYRHPLGVQLAALLVARGITVPDGAEPLDALLDNEIRSWTRHWSADLRQPTTPRSRARLHQAVALVALTRPTPTELPELVGCLPAGDGGEPESLAGWLSGLFPDGDTTTGFGPAGLTEALLSRTERLSTLLDNLHRSPRRTTEHTANLLTTLLESYQDPAIPPALFALVSEHLAELADEALTHPTALLADPLDAVLTRLSETEEYSAGLAGRPLPIGPEAAASPHRRLLATVTALRVERLRDEAGADEVLAVELDILAAHTAATGRFRAAAEYAAVAADHHGRAGHDDAAALSLHNAAVARLCAGDLAPAVDLAGQTVTRLESLAEVDPTLWSEYADAGVTAAIAAYLAGDLPQTVVAIAGGLEVLRDTDSDLIDLFETIVRLAEYIAIVVPPDPGLLRCRSVRDPGTGPLDTRDAAIALAVALARALSASLPDRPADLAIAAPLVDLAVQLVVLDEATSGYAVLDSAIESLRDQVDDPEPRRLLIRAGVMRATWLDDPARVLRIVGTIRPLLTDAGDDRDEDTAQLDEAEGRALAATGHIADAVEPLSRAASTYHRIGSGAEWLAATRVALAGCLAELGRWDEAAEQLTAAVDQYRDEQVTDPERIGELDAALAAVARLQQRAGRDASATLDGLERLRAMTFEDDGPPDTEDELEPATPVMNEPEPVGPVIDEPAAPVVPAEPDGGRIGTPGVAALRAALSPDREDRTVTSTEDPVTRTGSPDDPEAPTGVSASSRRPEQTAGSDRPLSAPRAGSEQTRSSTSTTDDAIASDAETDAAASEHRTALPDGVDHSHRADHSANQHDRVDGADPEPIDPQVAGRPPTDERRRDHGAGTVGEHSDRSRRPDAGPVPTRSTDAVAGKNSGEPAPTTGHPDADPAAPLRRSAEHQDDRGIPTGPSVVPDTDEPTGAPVNFAAEDSRTTPDPATTGPDHTGSAPPPSTTSATIVDLLPHPGNSDASRTGHPTTTPRPGTGRTDSAGPEPHPDRTTVTSPAHPTESDSLSRTRNSDARPTGHPPRSGTGRNEPAKPDGTASVGRTTPPTNGEPVSRTGHHNATDAENTDMAPHPDAEGDELTRPTDTQSHWDEPTSTADSPGTDTSSRTGNAGSPPTGHHDSLPRPGSGHDERPRPAGSPDPEYHPGGTASTRTAPGSRTEPAQDHGTPGDRSGPVQPLAGFESASDHPGDSDGTTRRGGADPTEPRGHPTDRDDVTAVDTPTADRLPHNGTDRPVRTTAPSGTEPDRHPGAGSARHTDRDTALPSEEENHVTIGSAGPDHRLPGPTGRELAAVEPVRESTGVAGRPATERSREDAASRPTIVDNLRPTPGPAGDDDSGPRGTEPPSVPVRRDAETVDDRANDPATTDPEPSAEWLVRHAIPGPDRDAAATGFATLLLGVGLTGPITPTDAARFCALASVVAQRDAETGDPDSGEELLAEAWQFLPLAPAGHHPVLRRLLWLAAGHCRLRTDPDIARDAFDQDRRPDEPWQLRYAADHGTALALLRSGDRGGAIAALRRARECCDPNTSPEAATPRYEATFILMELSLQDHDDDTALEAAEELVDTEDPSLDPAIRCDAYQVAVLELLDQDRAEDALRLAEELPGRLPGGGPHRVALGSAAVELAALCRHRLGDVARLATDAEVSARVFAQHHPPLPRVRLVHAMVAVRLAQLRHGSGQQLGALHWLTESLQALTFADPDRYVTRAVTDIVPLWFDVAASLPEDATEETTELFIRFGRYAATLLEDPDLELPEPVRDVTAVLASMADTGTPPWAALSHFADDHEEFVINMRRAKDRDAGSRWGRRAAPPTSRTDWPDQTGEPVAPGMPPQPANQDPIGHHGRGTVYGSRHTEPVVEELTPDDHPEWSDDSGSLPNDATQSMPVITEEAAAAGYPASQPMADADLGPTPPVDPAAPVPAEDAAASAVAQGEQRPSWRQWRRDPATDTAETPAPGTGWTPAVPAPEEHEQSEPDSAASPSPAQQPNSPWQPGVPSGAVAVEAQPSPEDTSRRTEPIQVPAPATAGDDPASTPGRAAPVPSDTTDTGPVSGHGDGVTGAGTGALPGSMAAPTGPVRPLDHATRPGDTASLPGVGPSDHSTVPDNTIPGHGDSPAGPASGSGHRTEGAPPSDHGDTSDPGHFNDHRAGTVPTTPVSAAEPVPTDRSVGHSGASGVPAATAVGHDRPGATPPGHHESAAAGRAPEPQGPQQDLTTGASAHQAIPADTPAQPSAHNHTADLDDAPRPQGSQPNTATRAAAPSHQAVPDNTPARPADAPQHNLPGNHSAHNHTADLDGTPEPQGPQQNPSAHAAAPTHRPAPNDTPAHPADAPQHNLPGNHSAHNHTADLDGTPEPQGPQQSPPTGAPDHQAIPADTPAHPADAPQHNLPGTRMPNDPPRVAPPQETPQAGGPAQHVAPAGPGIGPDPAGTPAGGPPGTPNDPTPDNRQSRTEAPGFGDMPQSAAPSPAIPAGDEPFGVDSPPPHGAALANPAGAVPPTRPAAAPPPPSAPADRRAESPAAQHGSSAGRPAAPPVPEQSPPSGAARVPEPSGAGWPDSPGAAPAPPGGVTEQSVPDSPDGNAAHAGSIATTEGTGPRQPLPPAEQPAHPAPYPGHQPVHGSGNPSARPAAAPSDPQRPQPNSAPTVPTPQPVGPPTSRGGPVAPSANGVHRPNIDAPASAPAAEAAQYQPIPGPAAQPAPARPIEHSPAPQPNRQQGIETPQQHPVADTGTGHPLPGPSPTLEASTTVAGLPPVDRPEPSAPRHPPQNAAPEPPSGTGTPPHGTPGQSHPAPNQPPVAGAGPEPQPAVPPASSGRTHQQPAGAPHPDTPVAEPARFSAPPQPNPATDPSDHRTPSGPRHPEVETAPGAAAPQPGFGPTPDGPSATVSDPVNGPVSPAGPSATVGAHRDERPIGGDPHAAAGPSGGTAASDGPTSGGKLAAPTNPAAAGPAASVDPQQVQPEPTLPTAGPRSGDTGRSPTSGSPVDAVPPQTAPAADPRSPQANPGSPVDANADHGRPSTMDEHPPGQQPTGAPTASEYPATGQPPHLAPAPAGPTRADVAAPPVSAMPPPVGTTGAVPDQVTSTQGAGYHEPTTASMPTIPRQRPAVENPGHPVTPVENAATARSAAAVPGVDHSGGSTGAAPARPMTERRKAADPAPDGPTPPAAAPLPPAGVTGPRADHRPSSPGTTATPVDPPTVPHDYGAATAPLGIPLAPTTSDEPAGDETSAPWSPFAPPSESVPESTADTSEWTDPNPAPAPADSPWARPSHTDSPETVGEATTPAAPYDGAPGPAPVTSPTDQPGDTDVVVAELVPSLNLPAVGEPGSSAQVLWTAAQALRTAGKLDEAAECLREIVRVGQIDVDRHAQTQLVLAQTLLDGGNSVQAMAEAKRVATGSTGVDTRSTACLLWAQSALAHGDRSQTALILTELAGLTATEPDIDSAHRMAETMSVLARWWSLR